MDRVAQLIEAASKYAKNAHGDQKRKYTGEPYWNHLCEVAMTLRKFGATPDVIAAGYLHDTLEDTNVKYVNLVFDFDRNIAELVLQVTDVSRPEHGTRKIRKAIDRQYLAGASWRGQMIKCADMLSNTADIVANDDGFARIYVPENKLLIDVLDRVRTYCYPIWRAAYDQIVQAEQTLSRAA